MARPRPEESSDADEREELGPEGQPDFDPYRSQESQSANARLRPLATEIL